MPEDQTPSPESSGTPAAPPGGRPRGRRRRHVWRTLAVLVAIVAALLAATLTVDLGPALRDRAERAASNYLERPMHIGKLSVKLLSGTFIVEDVVIEGLSPSDRPFLRAKRIAVQMPWWSIVSGELIIQDVDMSDWDMIVEQFPNGRHNFPRFTRPSKKPQGPKRFTTTVRSVIARNGRFTYDDHGTPWTIVAPNLTVNVYRDVMDYRGIAHFSDGRVTIQNYEPFRVDMQSRFKIDGGFVRFDRIDLESDGARSAVTGYVDLGHWPEQLWNVRSRVDFPIQKAIFFKGQSFDVSGHGDFDGTFHLFKGGRELKGTFTSPEAGVDDWRFPNVKGSLLWVPEKFEVTHVTTDLHGGRATFDYLMGPFGHGRRANAVWNVRYENVDLTRLTDFLELKGIRLAGLASGVNRMTWPLGRFADKRGDGDITVTPPPGMQPMQMMTRALTPDLIAKVDPLPPLQGPFNTHLQLGHVPVAGRIAYTFTPDWVTIPNGWAATGTTYVEFNDGRTAWGRQSRMPFHVTSLDWQSSDRLLAGIMTAFGAPTGAVPVGGRGQFDGVMLEAFTKPRIEGRFEGDRMRAWDVVWGHGRADLVIHDSYLEITNSVIDHEGSQIFADGRFALGYPRRDGGEEINARIRIERRPLADLRHAFELDDYLVDGFASGEYHLFGKYETPFGFGRLVIDEGKAYGETFDNATANLRFEGNGVRLDGIEIAKATGHVTGAAWVGWDGTYSFNADGRRIPVESLTAISFPRAPLSGLMQFTATGAGTFEEPRYDVKLRVDDLFAGDEGIGQVTSNIALRGELLTLEVEAASPRLAVTGSGRLALTPEMDADFTLRFSDTSLDPYVRFFQPKLSPFTTAVADGSIHGAGELADIDHLVVDARIDRLNLKLFDYPARNEGPIELSLNQHVIKIGRFRLAGEGTALELGGQVSLHDSRIAVEASGDANLGILQGLFRDIRSSGSASLKAAITGPLADPVFSGSAKITDGRIRYFALPHSLESIDGTISFDAQGIHVDDLSARLGGGEVRFGGRVGMKGYVPGELNLTATGEQMHLRYPEGFRSIVDADLALRGDIASPIVTGTVTVHDAVWTRRFEPTPDLFSFASNAPPIGGAPSPTIPIRFDLQIDAPGTLRVENNIARITSSADLTLRGTYDRPLLFGRADVDRGEILFEGNRYLVTRGTIEFANPARIEPFFDIEAETRVRLPSQTYRITISVTGIATRLNVQFDADPPLPAVDIIALLFGQTTNVENAELRALQPQAAAASEEALLRASAARLLTGTLTGQVGRVAEQVLGIDTLQISPSLGTESDPLTPTARLVIGKRISNRAYLTFARALGAVHRDQIIILEYDQSERVGWVLTQNGDRSFALEFRVRHVF